MPADPPTPDEFDDDAHREFRREELLRLRELAAAGDPQAQRDLGCSYIHGPESGYEVDADPALARHWYVLAAEQGHDEAMWDVCQMLLDGEGGPPDIERGLRYLRTLARRRKWNYGSECAAELLSFYQSEGKYGLEKDPKLIAEWEKRARDMKRKYGGFRRRHG